MTASETSLARGLAVFYQGAPLMSVEEALALLGLLFDTDYYARTYPDLAPADQTLAHYLASGWRDGRNPSAIFDTSGYLAANPYLVELDFCPLLHYALNGAAEGRQPSLPPAEGWRARAAVLFDPVYYHHHYPPVAPPDDPFAHYLREGWREGRNPGAGFDTRYYLEANPDVRAAGLCPLVHYVTEGSGDGRLPLPPPDPAAVAAAGARKRAESLAAWRRPIPPQRTGKDALETALAAALERHGNGVLLSLSHDDYAAVTGGLQNCIADEEQAFNAAGYVHLHASPAEPLIVLAEESEDLPVSVRIDGRPLGIAALGTVARALARARPPWTPLHLAIHHLMGFAPEAVIAAARIAPPDRSVIMVHDLFTLCPQFALLRDNVTFCGGPPATSSLCQSCTYGAERPDHQRRIAALFAALDPVVLTGSASAADFWRERADYRYRRIEVAPPARLSLDADFRPARTAPPLHVGFLGGPSYHKGWDVFETLASRHFGDRRYRFFHLGFATDTPSRNIRYVHVAVSPADRQAMIREVLINDLDIVINWSRCFETFSWTAHEAVAGGALVIARRAAGNVWPSLSRPDIDRAVALDSEAELYELFAGGRVFALDLRRRYGSLAVNPTTAIHLLGVGAAA